MALLTTTPPEKAEGKLAELYATSEQVFGVVPNNVRMLGVSPMILENQFDLVGYYMGHKTLSTALLAMIRMLVSKGCRSPYCETLNTGLLLKQNLSMEQIEAAKADPSKAPLSEKEKALLLFVLKATDDPHSTNAEDIANLKNIGWTEQDIFDAVAHGARIVGTNIIFDTFKIDIDF